MSNLKKIIIDGIEVEVVGGPPLVSDGNTLAIMIGNAVQAIICNLAPLLVLTIKKWPVIASTRTQGL